eukprot:9177224-Heterocapsa_arctica.AAC.1
MRHLEVKRLWLQEETKQKRICIEHISGESNISDVLTKALNSARYQMLRQQLGLRTIDDDGDDNMINVLEIYRAPRCSRCTLRVGFYVEMEIQVTEEGIA